MGRRDFGRYKIVEEVGRGAMGVVYRSTDSVMERTVAIKAINLSYIEGVGVRSSEYFERFRREAEVAGRLNHPNIVKIFDLGPDYLVMEFIEGRSLASLIQTRLRPEKILRIVAEVADALDYAHDHGVVHRDIKPANIMIQPDGTAKVMDFGLARIESSTLTAAGEVLGSVSYMAPEVVLGRPADARSDIFSLGVVAYEMMTRDRPFSGRSITVIINSILRENPRPARELNLNLPPEYDSIFARVLAKEPTARYASASAFASELALRKWAEPEPAAEARPPAVATQAGQVRGAGGGDEGGQTVMMVDASEVGSADVVELPSAMLVPLEDTLVPSEASTETQSPGGQVARAAREAAAAVGGMGASEVLGDDVPVPTVAATAPASPRASAAPRKRLPMPLVLGGALALVLAVAFGLSLLAYWVLVRGAPGAPRATEAAAAGEVTPLPEPSPEPSAEPLPTPTPEPATVPPTTAASALATLTVSSDPPGARVVVGRKQRGVTPLRVQLPPGRLSVAVEQDGFRPWTRDVTLPAAGLALEARLEALPREVATPTPTPDVKAGDLVPLGPGVTPPKRISGKPPTLSASRLTVSGSVVIEFIVDEEGRVVEPKVVEPVAPDLDSACLEAIRGWRYAPATAQGVHVKVVQRAKFTFQPR